MFDLIFKPNIFISLLHHRRIGKFFFIFSQKTLKVCESFAVNRFWKDGSFLKVPCLLICASTSIAVVLIHALHLRKKQRKKKDPYNKNLRLLFSYSKISRYVCAPTQAPDKFHSSSKPENSQKLCFFTSV